MELFKEYEETINRINKINKRNLLVPDLLIGKEADLEVFYAPFEYLNRKAKVVITGITPGYIQMENAYKSFVINKTNKDRFKIVKDSSSFSGPMRKILIKYLDEIKLNEFLEINSCESLFNENSNLLHSTSLIKYPVFKNKKNYTGYSPEIFSSSLLKRVLLENYTEEIYKLDNPVIIPLGKAVEKVLLNLSKKGLISKDECLFGFPHPSPANGHREKQFREKKQHLCSIIQRKKTQLG